MANIFHVQDSILLANGFIKEVFDDKDGEHDLINTLRFIHFTKRINDEIVLEVIYTYTTEDAKQYKLHSSVVQLNVDDSYFDLPILKLSSLLNLILILKGND